MPSEKWVFQGREFDSEAAWKLYRDSRCPAPAPSAGKGASLGAVMWVAVALAGGMWVLLSAGPSKPRAASGPVLQAPAPAGLSDASKGTLATIINLNGELCGAVVAVRPLGADRYSVDCTRYRSGEGSAQYTVDLATGSVR